ncbi:hypothetical protein ACIOHE_29125 [Streptomyces sp. NPDC087851]|uniref:hypothetical protein n=1 Tax=Streptomyces sp. NPDC087851 TaxID=3365810 RepID=UPI0037F92FA5
MDQEEAVFCGELAALREKVTVAEGRLAHLTITRETLLTLVGEEYTARDDVTQPASGGTTGGQVPNEPGPDSRSDDAEVPLNVPASAGLLAWEVARERMLVVSAGAGRAMKVQDIAAAIGEDVSGMPKEWRVETTRSRLKRLVKEGRVVEGPTAWFAIAPVSSGAQGQEATQG